MLQFDNNGYLKPYDLIDLNVHSFKQSFAVSSVRKVIFDEYHQHLTKIKEVCPSGFFQWIDGSYTTKKPLPFDIDLVTFVEYNAYFQHMALFKKLEKVYPHIDAHFAALYPDTHKKAYETQLDKLYWRDVYGTDRSNRPKGFIQIKFEDMTVTEVKDDATMRIMKTIDLIRHTNFIIETKKNSDEPIDTFGIEQYQSRYDKLIKELKSLLQEIGINLPFILNRKWFSDFNC